MLHNLAHLNVSCVSCVTQSNPINQKRSLNRNLLLQHPHLLDILGYYYYYIIF